MAALAECASCDMRGDEKAVSVALVSLGAVDEGEVVQSNERMSSERTDRRFGDPLGEQGGGKVVRRCKGTVPVFPSESVAAQIGPNKLKARPEPAVLIPTDGTAADIVAAVEAADVGIKGGGERIVVVAHGLNGFVLTYYTSAAEYPFIIGKLFFIKVRAPDCKDFFYLISL